MSLQFEVPTWNQIHKALLNIAETIMRSSFRPDVIVAISRGGWIPARIMTDLLGSPNLADVKAEFYNGIATRKTEPVLRYPVTTEVADRRILIVDEITDTGRSLDLVKSCILHEGALEIKTATLYRKPWTAAKPDYWGKETSRWVVFPWETRETIQEILEKSVQTGHPSRPEVMRLVKAGVPSRLAIRFMKEINEEYRLAETR